MPSNSEEPVVKVPVFPNSIVYCIELPFCFEYEFECFELLTYECRKAFVALERKPKRKWNYKTLPPRTAVTLVIQLLDVDIKQVKERYSDLASNLKEEGWQVLMSLIKAYRRITKDYFSYAPVDGPSCPEEFTRNSEYTIIINGKPVIKGKVLLVERGFGISVNIPMPEKLKAEIALYAQDLLVSKDNIWNLVMDLYDLGVINYHYHRWQISLIQSVVAMETVVSWFILKSLARNHIFMLRKNRLKSDEDLNREYKDALGLPKRIDKYLFPLFKHLKINGLISRLRKIRPLISNNKKTGAYDIRNAVVHQGSKVTEKEAKESLQVCEEFLKIISEAVEGMKSLTNKSTRY